MDGLRTKIRVIGALTVFGTGAAAAMATGCGDDTMGTVSPPEDAQADTTQPDASQQDVTQPDVAAEAAPQDASTDATHPDAGPDVTQPDASPDVAQDVSHPDTSTDAPADAPQDVQQVDARPDASDGGAPDVTDADAGTDSSDAAATSDATDGGACMTTIGELNDGGTSRLLFAFDNHAGIDLGWSAYTGGGTSALLGLSATDGYLCGGALQLSLNYIGYGVQSGIDYDFTKTIGVQNWTGRTRLHFWVKVVTSDYTTINGVQGIVESKGFTMPFRFGTFLNGQALSTVAAGGWIESVVDLATPGADLDLTTVDGFEIRLNTVPTLADGGPAVPPPSTLLVDDIWLE